MSTSNTSTPRKQLVSVAVAAQHLDIHPITLRRWVSAGRVNAYRVGPRLLKVDLNELDELLTSIPTASVGAA